MSNPMQLPEVKVGKRYCRNRTPNCQDECRVMAIVEGWVMARFTGAMPFLLRVNDFCNEFIPVRRQND